MFVLCSTTPPHPPPPQIASPDARAYAFAVIYRYAPSRDEPQWRWISWGSAVAALLWLGLSALFSYYAANFGTFDQTYGSLGAVIGFMLWIWLSVIVVLLGGKLNAEIEHQAPR